MESGSPAPLHSQSNFRLSAMHLGLIALPVRIAPPETAHLAFAFSVAPAIFSLLEPETSGHQRIVRQEVRDPLIFPHPSPTRGPPRLLEI